MTLALPVAHGFTHAPDWTWAQIGCASCGFHELWADLRDDSGARPRNRRLRAMIHRDMRALLQTRGCTHV